jgi:Domain of unknown function (DUF6457)
MNVLDEWTTAVRTALDLDAVESGPVLRVARDVAHGVTRPAAPLTAYLLGVAVGRGADPKQAAETVTDLVRSWPHPPE